VFPFNPELEALLKAQKAMTDALKPTKGMSDGDLREAVANLAARDGTVLGHSASIAVNDDDRNGQFIGEKVEAPPGFEPGVEVLQTSALPLGDGAP
jgi:hypothetical protein